ncbi:GGDEF domain-containing protein [Campylobacter majalis]|uniref:GGDEF domain-containing protein n=1 Tax=Campylobacter majalis TaxID=2790656 RepID=UPI003D69C458
MNRLDINPNNYKSIQDIHSSLLNILLIAQAIGFMFILSTNSLIYIVLIICILITLYIKNEKFLQKSNLIATWFHTNILFIAVACTMLYGNDAGFIYLLVGLVFISYFCAFNTRILTYLIATFEIIVAVLLYVISQDRTDNILNNNIYNLMHIGCFVATFFTIYILSSYANIITSHGYQDIKKEQNTLEKLSQYDQLTGLLNRRSMQKIIKTKNKQAVAENIKTNKVVMIGDIDDFKSVNDTFGHLWGDRIIKDVASVLKNSFRQHDLISRWGGEEFLIVLTDTNIDFIYSISNRLLQNISAIRLPNNTPVTMTFGMIILIDQVNFDFDYVLERADKLLYKGKQSGKDHIEMEVIK